MTIADKDEMLTALMSQMDSHISLGRIADALERIAKHLEGDKPDFEASERRLMYFGKWLEENPTRPPKETLVDYLERLGIK